MIVGASFFLVEPLGEAPLGPAEPCPMTMHTTIRWTAVGLLLGGCAGSRPSSSPATKSANVTTQLTADTPVTTSSGATFEAPKGWFLTRSADRVTLQGPERDLTATLLEMSEPDATKAITAAWAKVQPNVSRKIAQSVTPPETDGWDAVTQIMYETGTGEEHAIGIARRKGAVQYVMLLVGASAGIDRRAAQIGTVVSTFKAPGIAEESLAGRPIHSFDESRQRLLERFVETAMHETNVPGVAISVVENGKLTYAKGFGVKEKGKSEPISADSLFMIGSTTKSLTTLMMARLVDQKKFEWSTPVARVLPSFALADAETTKKVTMLHTVCACTGLPRQDLDFIFEYTRATPEGRVMSMRSMTPTTGFGETFQYSNTMVATGGYVAAHARNPHKSLGAAYDEAMQALVFDPLEMKNTTLSIDTALKRDHAMPHGENLKAELHPIPLAHEGGIPSVSPAGAAWSTAKELASFVALELASGRDAKGNAIVSEANLLERRKPQVKISDKSSYGLGLFIDNQHGVPVVHHGGNTLGFTSDMFFFPKHGTGVVVLTNAGGAGAFRSAVHRRFLELFFDAREDAAKKLAFMVKAGHESTERALAKIGFDEAVAHRVAGNYNAVGLGKITLGADGMFDAGEWKSRFGTKKEADGAVSLILLEPPIAGLELRIDGTSLVIDAGQDKRRFVREPDTAATAHRKGKRAAKTKP